MADKRTKEEILEEIRREDSTKDVPINSAVIIAVLSAISSVAETCHSENNELIEMLGESMCGKRKGRTAYTWLVNYDKAYTILSQMWRSGTVACLSIGFLEIYRQDVIAFWMACIPVGVHISLLLATLLTGGAGYGYSIEPVFINRKNCKIVSEDRGPCDKETLLYLYVINGGVALGFSVISLVYSLITCSCATKRRNQRETMEHVEHEKQLELQKRASRRSHEKVTYVPSGQGVVTRPEPAATAHHAVKSDCSNGSLKTAKRGSTHDQEKDDHNRLLSSAGESRDDNAHVVADDKRNKDSTKSGDATTHL
ncbi:hypothetical protein Btru_076528 [Bulinus truncatus]|nr:hypothetical protein Btru_076528 [Bulinus truncatus]